MKLAASKGKWFSAWTGAATTQAPRGAGDCTTTMTRLLQEGADTGHAMQVRGFWKGMTVQQTTLAAFLIARGPSAAIILPPYDRPMLKSPFGFEGVDPDADPGVPLGPGTAGGPGNTTFTRAYTKADVSLDCTAFKATIVFK